MQHERARARQPLQDCLRRSMYHCRLDSTAGEPLSDEFSAYAALRRCSGQRSSDAGERRGTRRRTGGGKENETLLFCLDTSSSDISDGENGGGKAEAESGVRL